ncbi:MAG: SMP-30/gluconolactonase/LRE family protein, partial [Acetobacteraceae bacterium]|nr:SMP-30/gluconolactonase/LRE family protein [Acetobacteraceae bacterium]
GPRLHRCDATGQARQSWDLPDKIGFIALTQRPERLLLGLESGLHLFAPDSGEAGGLRRVSETNAWPPRTRPNDGKVDRSGRLWFGTMETDQRPGAGALYRFDRNGRCRSLEQGWTIPNGPAFSPDHARLYWGDSARRTVFAFDFHPDAEPKNPRVFLRFADNEPGVPDGMAADTEGCLWVAHNGGGCIARYSPGGQCMGRVPFPARAVSSCAFGGIEMSTLFVTTARQGAGPDDEPDACGALFAVETTAQGLPAGSLSLDQ